tara:strand:+ start:365 stop:733 length:369 start_codon:yes stop_codon:yes gene_type:complete
MMINNSLLQTETVWKIDRLKVNALIQIHFGENVSPTEINTVMNEVESNASWVRKLDPVRQTVLIDLAIHHGFDLFLNIEIVEAFRNHKFEDLAACILYESSSDRAYRLAEMALTGAYCLEIR